MQSESEAQGEAGEMSSQISNSEDQNEIVQKSIQHAVACIDGVEGYTTMYDV